MYDIELENVSVYYDNVCALKDIILKVKEKEFLGIIGPNGGGKTTLIKVLLGLIKPSTGTVKTKEDITMGYVPQFTFFNRQFPVNVIDVILMGKLRKPMRLFHKFAALDVEKADIIMEQLGILELRNRQIKQLSGGQLQKVLMARALAVEPRVLLLDEPTASIDAHYTTEIYEILKKINQQVTIVLITHDIGAISTYVDSIACLNRELFYHEDAKLTDNSIQKVYGCPIDLIAHGLPHRILKQHEGRVS